MTESEKKAEIPERPDEDEVPERPGGKVRSIPERPDEEEPDSEKTAGAVAVKLEEAAREDAGSIPGRPGEVDPMVAQALLMLAPMLAARAQGDDNAAAQLTTDVDKFQTALPPRTDDDEYRRKYWEKMDNLFHRTIEHAEFAFKVNIWINIVVVAIGIFILAYSTWYSWVNGLDLYSTAFGSLGVISFISTFYLTPQDRIQRTVGDLAQIQMCYRTYCMQWENLGDWQRDHRYDITIEQLKDLNKQLEDFTIAITKNIEDIIGKKDSTPSTEPETESKQKQTSAKPEEKEEVAEEEKPKEEKKPE